MSSFIMPRYLQQPTFVSPAMGPGYFEYQNDLNKQKQQEMLQALNMFSEQERIKADNQIRVAQAAQPKAFSYASGIGGKERPQGQQQLLLSALARAMRPQPQAPSSPYMAAPQTSMDVDLDAIREQERRDRLAEIRLQALEARKLESLRNQHSLQQIAEQRRPSKASVLLNALGNLRGF